jgi:hypothetical protein
VNGTKGTLLRRCRWNDFCFSFCSHRFRFARIGNSSTSSTSTMEIQMKTSTIQINQLLDRNLTLLMSHTSVHSGHTNLPFQFGMCSATSASVSLRVTLSSRKRSKPEVIMSSAAEQLERWPSKLLTRIHRIVRSSNKLCFHVKSAYLQTK